MIELQPRLALVKTRSLRSTPAKRSNAVGERRSLDATEILTVSNGIFAQYTQNVEPDSHASIDPSLNSINVKNYSRRNVVY
jgi:hypothetical protein